MGDHLPPRVRIYTRKWCGFCFMAKRLLDELDIDFEEIPLDGNAEFRWQISAKAGNWPTVPMIFVGDQFIGGYTEAASLNRKGGLVPLCRPE